MIRKLKNILAAAFVCILLICLATCLGISAGKHEKAVCSGIRISITDSTECRFVSESEISEYIGREFGSCTGKPVGSIELSRIEKFLDNRSAVLKSEAYITPDGMLNIDITQRQPVIRFEGTSGGFYADRDGYIFPLRENYTSHVPIVNGHIPVRIKPGYKGPAPDEESGLWLRKILSMTDYMDRSRIWGENIVQIYVRENGDLIMVPRDGKERFIFGGPESFEDKFMRMGKYYTAIRPSKEDGRYSTVNVKYDGQIICR